MLIPVTNVLERIIGYAICKDYIKGEVPAMKLKVKKVEFPIQTVAPPEIAATGNSWKTTGVPRETEKHL